MKKLYMICLLLLWSVAAMAQDFEIVSVEHLEGSIQAIDNKVTEPGNNGRECALLRIATQKLTQNQQDSFEFGTDAGSRWVKRASRDGEIWLWVTPGIRYLIIKGIGLGGSRELAFDNYGISIQSLKTYKITIRGTADLPPRPTQQYLMFSVSPKTASVEVNGRLWDVNADGDASEYVDFGTYTYHVRAVDYFDEEGTVTVNDRDNTVTKTVTLRPNFAQVTLKVDADAEIWVNNEFKGVRTWTGTLGSRLYRIECRQDNHETSYETLEITPKMDGQTIILRAPKPIYGSLKLESTPAKAKIFIDGEEMGVTPRSINEILIGHHEVRLEKANCAPLVKGIVIKKGETLELNERLDSGRNVYVRTDRAGDKVYVDGTYVGETPRHIPLGFGRHTIIVKRGKNEEEKELNITTSTTDQELVFEFGRIITIHTDQEGAVVYVDGEKVGTSPVSIDLDFGEHRIYAARNKKYASKTINVRRSGGETEHFLTLKRETASVYVENGVGFVTLNAAMSIGGIRQPSYGFTVGYTEKVGFFFTAMTNFRFAAMKAPLTCDSEGLVNGEYPDYTGESYNSRLSVMGGILINLDAPSPCYLRFGAGYGLRTRCMEISDGRLVKVEDSSLSTVDLTAGLQLNIKGFTMSLDAVTSAFKTCELKLGLGYCWKNKRK